MEMMASLAIVFAFVADVRATTSFGIASQSASGNAAAFATDTSGRCASLLDTSSSCTVTQDCSAMSTYACGSYYTQTITDLGGGEYKLLFDGDVAGSTSECGESSCPTCTDYKTCAGPMIQTDAQTVAAGDCIIWEYSTTGGGDAFETFVAVFDSGDNIISYDWKRGTQSGSLPYVPNQLTISTAGSYYLKFYLASYDESGGGYLGAQMQVRNIYTGTCIDPALIGQTVTDTTTSTVLSTITVTTTITSRTITATSTTTTSSSTTSTTTTSSTATNTTTSTTASTTSSSTTFSTTTSTSGSSTTSISSSTTSFSTTSFSTTVSTTSTITSTTTTSTASVTLTSTTTEGYLQVPGCVDITFTTAVEIQPEAVIQAFKKTVATVAGSSVTENMIQVQFILGSACAAGRRLQNGDGDGDGAGDAGDAGDGDGNDAGTAQNVTGGEVSALTFVIEFPPDQPEVANLTQTNLGNVTTEQVTEVLQQEMANEPSISTVQAGTVVACTTTLPSWPQIPKDSDGGRTAAAIVGSLLVCGIVVVLIIRMRKLRAPSKEPDPADLDRGYSGVNIDL